MDWDKLRFFHAVAEAGSFTSAGETLNLSQSAISRQVSALEQDLDVLLFNRHSRGLTLTEQGEILYKTTKEISSKLSLVQGHLHDTHELPRGTLRITVSDFIGSTWLAPLLVDFREQYPDVQLTIIFEDRVLNLNTKEADAGIRLHAPTQGDLIKRHLAQIKFYICASKHYLDRYGRPGKPEDLKHHTLMAFPENIYAPFENPNWLFHLAKADVEHDSNLLMINSMYAIHRAVRAHTGIAVMPGYLIYGDPELEIILPDHQRPPVDMYLVFAEERRNSKRLNIFRDFLIEKIAQMSILSQAH